MSNRFIMIDNNIGYVFGDTDHLPKDHVFLAGEFAGEKAGTLEISPELACRWMDEVIGEVGREYEECRASDFRGATGHLVYRVDINGSEDVPAIEDGTDENEIDAVKDRCVLVARIRIVEYD